MPLGAVVRFTPAEKIVYDVFSGEQVHAFLLKLINIEKPRLSEKLHDYSRSKPFAVSPIINPEKSGKHFYCIPGKDYYMRLTTISDDIADVLKKLFVRLPGLERMHLMKTPITVREIFITRDGHPQAGFCSYQEMIGEKPVESFSLIFHTPCSFRTKGKNLPLPLPEKMFKGYFHKWQLFSPVKFDLEEKELSDMVESTVSLTRYNIKTEVARFSRAIQIGFTGKVGFTLKSKNYNHLKILTALARFSFYCGTGYKSTMGMGQTEFLEGS